MQTKRTTHLRVLFGAFFICCLLGLALPVRTALAAETIPAGECEDGFSAADPAGAAPAEDHAGADSADPAGADPTETPDEADALDLSGISLPSWMRQGDSSVPDRETDSTSGKKIVSILGDSLGTFEGYNSPWNLYYYYYCEDYMRVFETWWMSYILNNDMQLGINDSLGGSKVGWWEGDPSGYNSKQCMAAEERIVRLDDNGTPDVILFFGGTNDIASTKLGEFRPGEGIGDVSTFCSAYQTALVRLREHYPQAEIICLTPYYRDISSWSSTTDKDVDLYADSILEICQYYGIRTVDLRQAAIDVRKDMCEPDYLHVNETGHYKIWHMLQYGAPALSSQGIRLLQNNTSEIRARYQVAGQTSDTQYQWQVYDCSKNTWIYASEWSSDDTFSYQPEAGGSYWLYCAAKNARGEQASDMITVSVGAPSISLDGLCWITKEEEIQVGAAYSGWESAPEFRWTSYNLDTKKWDLIDDWRQGNWSSWQPKKGNYWLHVEARDSSGNIVSRTINFAVGRNYPVYINGKYQGPNPYGEGWLIGVSSNINPQQKYRYELLILDCNKYVAGDPNPWIYGTGLKTLSSGKTFWTTWSPPHNGYYWTYFRIYDENDTLIEDQCFGALF